MTIRERPRSILDLAPDWLELPEQLSNSALKGRLQEAQAIAKIGVLGWTTLIPIVVMTLSLNQELSAELGTDATLSLTALQAGVALIVLTAFTRAFQEGTRQARLAILEARRRGMKVTGRPLLQKIHVSKT